MFNKTILAALILCACYLSTSQARPQVDLVKPVVQGVAQGATGSVLSQPTALLSELPKTALGAVGGATGGGGSPLGGLTSITG